MLLHADAILGLRGLQEQDLRVGSFCVSSVRSTQLGILSFCLLDSLGDYVRFPALYILHHLNQRNNVLHQTQLRMEQSYILSSRLCTVVLDPQAPNP